MGTRVINILAFSVLICIGPSCKKKDQGEPPVIIIHSPIENSNYNVYDNISISADITPAGSLASIKIGVVNNQKIPAMATVPLTPNPNSSAIGLLYNIYDIHLASGTYYVWVSATDNNGNQANAYRRITINEVPKARKGIYLISKPGTGILAVSKIDSVFAFQQKLNLSGDFSGSAVSSYHRQLYVAGKYSGNFNAIELNNHGIKWSVPGISGSTPWFTGVSGNEMTTYVSYYNGALKAYDHESDLNFSTVPSSGFYPLKSFAGSSYLLQEQKDLTGSSKKLVVYSAANGSGIKETPIAADVVEFYAKDADNIYMFSNTATQGKMEIYTVSGNGFWNRPLPSGKILSVAQVDPDTYLIGFDTGIVYKYTYFNNSCVSWLTGINAVKLRYDAVNGEVIVAEHKKVSSYGYGSAALNNSVNVPDTILDMHVLFNK